MLFETVKAEGLAHFSYLLGDESKGVAVVVDPRRDVELYLALARRHEVRITHILETHIHADFVSGSRELAARTGATIGVAAEGHYTFEAQRLAQGDTITVGAFKLKVLHTPGHTPEHICFVVSGGAGAKAPWGLFSGDTLFAGEVGRPDLLGEENEEPLARRLFHSLREKILPLGDEIIVYPAHGEGSPCGANIGDRPTTTIGYERQHNSLLQMKREAEFVERLLEKLEPSPAYYPRMKVINRDGPPLMGGPPHLRPLLADDFAAEVAQDNTLVLDLRDLAAFGAAHVENALNVPLREAFPVWAGRLLPEEARLLLVANGAHEIAEAQTHLLRIGFHNIGGYLRRGVPGWIEAGHAFVTLPQMSVDELRQELQDEKLLLLDVRTDAEWEHEHIPQATHIPLPSLNDRLEELPHRQRIATYCGSGFRASMAASILQRHGFEQVVNVPGSISAWEAAGYETR